MDERNAKKILKEMFKKILEFREKGIYPDNKFINNFYYLVQAYSDRGESESEEMYNLHYYFIENSIEESIAALNSVPKEGYINLLYEEINKIEYIIFLLNKLFTYLDRYYSKANSRQCLNKRSFDLYKNKFFNTLKKDIFHALTNYFKEFDKIDNEENEKKIKKIFKLMFFIDNIFNPKIVKENNELIWENEETEFHLQNNNLHEDTFEEWFNVNFLTELYSFVESKIKEIKNLPIKEYISFILNFKFQPINLKKYFNTTYYNKILYIFNENFIKGNKEKIEDYFFNLNRNDLKKFYEENKASKSCLQLICNSLIFSFEKKGMKAFEIKGVKINEKEPNKCLPIDIKNEFDKLFSDCFDKTDPNYNKYLNEISKLLFKKKSYSKELVSYINDCMIKKFRGKAEEEINNELKEIIQTFTLLTNKLDFQILLEKKMSERLLRNSSLSLYTEEKLVLMIKQEEGEYYTNKMTKMLSDLDDSNKAMAEYSKLKNKSLPNDLKFDVKLISQGPWKINNDYMAKMEIPPFLNLFCKDFEYVYRQRHHQSKLIWLNGLSKVDIKYLCFKNNENYVSKSTLLQYLILLQIEKFQKLSLGKIAQNIGCNDKLVLKDISGLIFNITFNPQHKKDKGILLGNFDDKKEEFNETDEVWFNYDFNYSKLRFNTMPTSIKKTKQELLNEEEEEKRINQKYQDNIIQSTIIRIMKTQSGKKVQHSWLISEVSKQINLFNAQPSQIKDNIEKIIEKNLIKRDEKDRSCYQYIS